MTDGGTVEIPLLARMAKSSAAPRETGDPAFPASALPPEPPVVPPEPAGLVPPAPALLLLPALPPLARVPPAPEPLSVPLVPPVFVASSSSLPHALTNASEHANATKGIRN